MQNRIDNLFNNYRRFLIINNKNTGILTFCYSPLKTGRISVASL